MNPGEYDLIRCIQEAIEGQPSLSGTLPGIGDDCAVFKPDPGKELAVSSDLYVCEVHFPARLDPGQIARHCLVAALSDLAAMGAKPLAFTLGICSPNPDWIKGLIPGCVKVITDYQISLIGGDLSYGSTNSLYVTVMGEVEPGAALTRGSANRGDDIWLSGYTGEAAAGLILLQEEDEIEAMPLPDHVKTYLINRFCSPTARIELGRALLGLASAAIDVSDGLLGDLGHMLSAGGLGARLDPNRVILSGELEQFLIAHPRYEAKDFTLAGGDDYEICFTAPPKKRAQIQSIADRLNITLSRIGLTSEKEGIQLPKGHHLPKKTGYQHFKND